MDALLGLDEKHNTATITIHSEIIRRLLAIERPTGKPIDVRDVRKKVEGRVST